MVSSAATKKIALNINFDSLSDCIKLVGGVRSDLPLDDPCFSVVADRFFKIANEYGAKFTIFIIAQDLENPVHAQAIARWHSMGHEIANHSYSHRHDLAALSAAEIQDEIFRAHEAITRAIGVQPQGFTAPGWQCIPEITASLKELGYLYDASLGPTWVFQLAQAVLWAKSSRSRSGVRLLRADWRANLFGQFRPYRPSHQNYLRSAPFEETHHHLMIPLPTIPWLRIGVWHTLALALPNWVFDWILHRALDSSDSFYYLMHPLDLLDPEQDLTGFPATLHQIQRMNVSIAKKEARFRRSLEIMSQHGTFVTMKEIATHSLSCLKQAAPLLLEKKCTAKSGY